MLGLSGPGHETARRMGLLAKLQPLSRHLGANVFHDRRGREVLRLNYHDLLGQQIEWLTLARTDLVAVLHEAAAPHAEIRFGTALAATREEGDRLGVTLTDGTEIEAELLIGADGARSALRRRLFGEDGAAAQPLGYRAAAFQAPDQLRLGEDVLSYAEPGRIAETYALAEGRLATLYIWRSDETGFVPPSDRRHVLRDAFRGAHPHALRWIDDLEEGAPVYLDALTMIDLPAWSRGRAVLLGDAAHCLTLVSGQGAGMAMSSAGILAEELANADALTALQRHEARLRPAIQRLQERSRRMAKWFVPESSLGFALRNAMLRWTPRRLLARHFVNSVRSELLLASGDARGARVE
jgi:2-polyprenyl-6-methoxyphenol hydroxylase-like FAD-dependent oxidoreductase